MTLEELRAEANKRGYQLVKKQPYIKYPTCTCKKSRVYRMHRAYEGTYFVCSVCGKASKPARWIKDAKANWNNGIWQ